MIKTKDELFQGYKIQPTEATKQEFIEQILRQNVPLDVKIAALGIMAEINMAKKWYGMAAKNYCYAGDLANTFKEKMDLYFKGAALYLRSCQYIEADDNFRKVTVLATNQEKPKIQDKVLLLYDEQAKGFESTKQLTKAIAAYNRMLGMKIPQEKAHTIRLKLIELYEKIGQQRESSRIKAQIQMLAQEQEEKAKPKPREYTAEDFL